MSLLKLLKIGQSLSETRNGRGRYKLTNENLLRTLARSSSPAPAQGKKTITLFAASSTSDRSPRLSAGSNSKAASPFQAFDLGVQTPLRGAAVERPTAPSLRDRIRIPRGGFKLAFPFKCAVRFHRPLTKIKLSLDQVAVVRNDLRDSDIEVLAPKRAASPFRSVAVPKVRLPKLDGRELWNRLFARALELRERSV